MREQGKNRETYLIIVTNILMSGKRTDEKVCRICEDLSERKEVVIGDLCLACWNRLLLFVACCLTLHLDTNSAVIIMTGDIVGLWTVNMYIVVSIVIV